MNRILNILIALLPVVVLVSCEDDDFGTFLSPNFPDIPVTYVNATTFGANPFIEVSVAGSGEIEFIMEIPENSGRTIRELSRVAAGTTAVNVGTLTAGTNYLDAAVPGSNNRVTFSTTLAEFETKRPGVDTDASDVLGFVFEIVLDNNTVIIPIEVEVRLTE